MMLRVWDFDLFWEGEKFTNKILEAVEAAKFYRYDGVTTELILALSNH